MPTLWLNSSSLLALFFLSEKAGVVHRFAEVIDKHLSLPMILAGFLWCSTSIVAALVSFRIATDCIFVSRVRPRVVELLGVVVRLGELESLLVWLARPLDCHQRHLRSVVADVLGVKLLG